MYPARGDRADDCTDDDAARVEDEGEAVAERVLSHAHRPIDWRCVSFDEAPLLWAALDTWVRWLVTRYSLEHRDVPPCWFRHPALVEELCALRTAHVDAFHPAHPPGGPAEWHTTLGNTRARLRDWAARTGCKPGAHRDDAPIAWSHGTDREYVDALDAFLIADRRRREAAEGGLLDQLRD